MFPSTTHLLLAEEAGLDLVEISPNATPPVVKILDLGKLKYANQKKAAEARKNQKVIEIKEIKMRPNIDDHDYETKMKAVRRFFEEGDKVKLTLRFRGREMAHMELGMQLLNKVREEDRHHRQGRSRAQARRPPDDDGAGATLTPWRQRPEDRPRFSESTSRGVKSLECPCAPIRTRGAHCRRRPGGMHFSKGVERLTRHAELLASGLHERRSKTAWVDYQKMRRLVLAVLIAAMFAALLFGQSIFPPDTHRSRGHRDGSAS